MKTKNRTIPALIITAVIIANSLTACGGQSSTDSQDPEVLEQKADQGDIDAMYDLGYIYLIGDGVEIDYGKAIECYRRAADQGLPVAIFAVGDCYYLGNGVEKDIKQAKKWYKKALKAGYEPDDEDKSHLIDVLGEEYSTQID